MQRLFRWISSRLSSGQGNVYAAWRDDTAVALPLLAQRSGLQRGVNDLEGLPFTQCLKLQQELAYTQVHELLVAVHRSSQEVVAVNVLAAAADELEAAASGRAFPAKSAVEAHADRLDEYLTNRCGFSLRVAPSGIDHPEAGKGVYLRGRAKAGTVLALYPGRVYLEDDVQAILDRYRKHEPSEDDISPYAVGFERLFGKHASSHSFVRFDGTVLNAAEGGPARENPYCQAHRVNHPPPGLQPNCMTLTFDFPGDGPLSTFGWGSDVTGVDENEAGRHKTAWRSLPEALEPYVPNSYFNPPRLTQRLFFHLYPVKVRSLVLLALRDIEGGEELFFDYRLNPYSKLPTWYCPLDEERDRRRWEPKQNY